MRKHELVSIHLNPVYMQDFILSFLLQKDTYHQIQVWIVVKKSLQDTNIAFLAGLMYSCSTINHPVNLFIVTKDRGHQSARTEETCNAAVIMNSVCVCVCVCVCVHAHIHTHNIKIRGIEIMYTSFG